jgi:ubiquinone/menaquinone biosynthesis C-methylase UbiE
VTRVYLITGLDRRDMTSVADRPGRPYPMDNNAEASVQQHRALAEQLDPVTTRRISDLVDPVGAYCLEVGAGGGSIATWLAERVGDDGRVVAVDLKPGQIPAHPRMEVRALDLTREDLPQGPFDLVHARLTLQHLPQREQILPAMVSVLRPGGVLLVEDWDASDTDRVVCAPDEASAALYARYQQLVGERVFAAAGTDRAWARHLHARFVDLGLVEVSTHVESEYWVGGGPGLAGLVGSTLVQVRDRLYANGFSPDEHHRMTVLVNDPQLVVRGFLLHSTSGVRPAVQPPEGDRRLPTRVPGCAAPGAA